MKITATELGEMRARVADGTASDDDRRLVGLYADVDANSEPEEPVGQTATVVGRADAEVIKGDPAPKKSTRRSSR